MRASGSARPRFLRTLIAAVALCASCRREHRPAPARRVILITCDTLRADHLGVYGCTRPTSPLVDAFAADATVFESAWSTAPMTCPAIASLLSGRLPEEIGMSPGNRALLPPEVVTLPEILSREGIATAAVVSNWMLRRPPPEQAEAGMQQGFEHFDDDMRTKEAHRDFFDRSGQETTDAAIAWLGPRRDRPDAPFFLWVHYQDPHGPYTPPERLARLFDRPPPEHEPRLPIGTKETGFGQIPAYQSLDGESRPSFYLDRYDAEIRSFDEAFGRLIAWLRENGMFEDSLIVFTADHGESLGEHGFWFCHGENLYGEEVRVPLVVRFPVGRGADRRGTRCGGLVSHLDLWPTALAAFGLEPRPSRGVSLFEAPPPDRIVPQANGVEGAVARWTGVTGERYRLVADRDGKPELYDLKEDPEELHDLAVGDPERVTGLLARRGSFSAIDVGPAVSRTVLRKTLIRDAATQKTLKRLGYTDGD